MRASCRPRRAPSAASPATCCYPWPATTPASTPARRCAQRDYPYRCKACSVQCDSFSKVRSSATNCFPLRVGHCPESILKSRGIAARGLKWLISLSIESDHGGDQSHRCAQLTKFARILFGMTAALVASNLLWFLPYYNRMSELGG